MREAKFVRHIVKEGQRKRRWSFMIPELVKKVDYIDGATIHFNTW